MPEGDTIHGLARRLRPKWQDALVEQARARELSVERALVNRRVREVSAWGKHLLVELDDDTTLRIHLGIGGMMRSERFLARLSDEVALTLRVGGGVWTVRRPRAVDRFSSRNLRRHPVLRRLGPDLITDEELLPAVVERALERARRTRFETVAELLLSQDVAAGIGNVYRSEILFLARVDPFAQPSTLDDATVVRLYDTAARALIANVGRRRNTTGRTDPALFVYGRPGHPCVRCHDNVTHLRLADRALFYCATCQSVAFH